MHAPVKILSALTHLSFWSAAVIITRYIHAWCWYSRIGAGSRALWEIGTHNTFSQLAKLGTSEWERASHLTRPRERPLAVQLAAVHFNAVQCNSSSSSAASTNVPQGILNKKRGEDSGTPPGRRNATHECVVCHVNCHAAILSRDKRVIESQVHRSVGSVHSAQVNVRVHCDLGSCTWCSAHASLCLYTQRISCKSTTYFVMSRQPF